MICDDFLSADGFVVFDEFCTLVARSQAGVGRQAQVQSARRATRTGDAGSTARLTMPGEKARDRAFDQYDSDEVEGGALSMVEILKATKTLFPGFDKEQALLSAYKAADTSGDGFISRREFKARAPTLHIKHNIIRTLCI